MMEWTKESDTHWTAPGGYSVERRVGHWMTFVPGEDQAIYIAPHMLDYADMAKMMAEKWAECDEEGPAAAQEINIHYPPKETPWHD